ncbi:hypothetical protein [Labedaea rhizosphaerae]|uniref:PPE family protein n=1 Tax=Labedaea rhizosphaerae TaxID=598644 RepID=A0A4V3D077_LABRH|nr:hypothetical protein [Labedaea rhizosphaerae]TDQ04715.1 hypothetical protein EV186_101670 [Labedaea rhizosphaerae]
MPDGQHYDDQQQYSGDEATNVKRASNHMPQEDRVRASQSELQAQYAQQQAAALKGHVEIDDRAVVDPPFWNGMDQTSLYKAATEQNEPGIADGLGRAFTQHGNALAKAANELNDALATLDAAWEGKAASTARGSIQPLASHSGQMGQSAQLMGTSLSQQSVAASEVQRLPPPMEFDATKALQHNKEVDANGGTPIDINAETGKANANKAEQVRFLTEYTNAMAAADKQMPVFVKPPETIKSGGGGGTSSVDGASVQSRKTGDVHNPYQGTSTGVPTSGSPQAGAADPNDPNNNNDIPTFGTPVAGTSTSGFTGSPSPVSTAPGLGSGPVGGTPHPAGPSAGSGGFGGSFGNFNGNAAGGAGAGEGGAGARGGMGAEGGRGAGARGLAGGMAAEEAFGRGGRGAGGAGMGGRGVIGGGHGAKDEEDEEHERPSYLVEPDPDAVFDTDQMTAPPVIGGE